MRISVLKRCVALAGCALTVTCSPRAVQVSDSGVGAFETALAPFGDGLVLAWYDRRDGNAELYFRLLDAEGRPDGPERRLTASAEDSFEASIDRLGDGLAVAWYERSGNGRHTAKLGMWQTDGSRRWEHTLGEGTRNPVVRSSGTAVLCVWIQSETGDQEAVLAGWWEADGRPRGAPVRLGPASRTTWNLNADIDPQGTGWVVFDAGFATRLNEVYVSKVAASPTGPVRLTTDDGAASKYPDVAVGEGGRVAVSWQDERDGNVEVYLWTGQLDELTGELDERSQRVTSTPGESDGAYIAWNGDRLGLAWSDRTGGQREVYFASFDRNGRRREPQRQITSTSAWSLVPAIRPHKTGFALAWTEYVPASVEYHIGMGEVFFRLVP